MGHRAATSSGELFEGLACGLANALLWFGVAGFGLIVTFCAGVAWMYLRQQDTELQGPKP